MSFDVAASAYDSFMGRYSYPLATLFVEGAKLPASGRVLDVGCGTGALTAALADRLGEGAVTGIDPSEKFVEAARERFPRAVISRASAEALPFADAEFDAALAGLVVHFMADPQAGVGEMVRVTRPGGVVALSVWDFVGLRAPQSTFFRALTSVAPQVEDESGRAGAAAGELARLLRHAGCSEVTSGEIPVSVSYATFEDWWTPYTLGVGPAGGQLAALDDAGRDRVQDLCRSLMPAAPFTITATAWTARGVVVAG